MQAHPVTPTVIVLASGRGQRFMASGGTQSKLQALLCGKTVLQHTLDAVQASGLPWHLEDAGHPGMGDSIAAAVAATAQAAGWLILPGDLPLVQSATLRVVAEQLRHAPVVVPCYQGVRGHPVGFCAVCRADLLALAGSQGAAAVVKKHGATLLETDDAGIQFDIDTLADLARAQDHLQSLRQQDAL